MQRILKIGTRESQLAVWQATLVKDLLEDLGLDAELEFVRSEGDIDLNTPLYAMGVQGVFTRTLDAALLQNRIDIAVHSMKDVPIQLPQGITDAAVLKRASPMDILVVNGEMSGVREKLKISAGGQGETIRIATSSIRRKAQWLHRYPNHQIENLRGNVNTRLAKLASSDWQGAIFAAAGLERIHLRPPQSIELDWMLPAPAQGAIIVVCREHDESVREICKLIHDDATGLCTRIERGFLKTLMGGCSTPVSALAELEEDEIYFRGSIISLDGKQKVEVERVLPADQAWDMGKEAAVELLNKGGDKIAEQFRRGSNYDTK